MRVVAAFVAGRSHEDVAAVFQVSLKAVHRRESPSTPPPAGVMRCHAVRRSVTVACRGRGRFPAGAGAAVACAASSGSP